MNMLLNFIDIVSSVISSALVGVVVVKTKIMTVATECITVWLIDEWIVSRNSKRISKTNNRNPK